LLRFLVCIPGASRRRGRNRSLAADLKGDADYTASVKWLCMRRHPIAEHKSADLNSTNSTGLQSGVPLETGGYLFVCA
jgi:hypothetical protein